MNCNPTEGTVLMSRKNRVKRSGLVVPVMVVAFGLLLSVDASPVSAQVDDPWNARWLVGNSLPEHPGEYPASVTLIPNPRTDLTYAGDIAPIIQENCVKCHRPGSVAPMPLETYEQVRPFAPMIRDRVIRRVMPPWPVDRTVGITEFKNDPSLTEEEIRTIVDWVDSGAALGDLADLPEPIQWPDGRTWEFQDQLGPPHAVFQSPMYTVEANGMDQWPAPRTPLEEVQIEGEPITTERWIRAIAVRPHSSEARNVFHHANPGLIMPGEAAHPMEARSAFGQGVIDLIDSAIGTEGRVFPEGHGRVIRPGSVISWGLHYHPYEHDINAALQVAAWFYPDGYKPEHYSMGDPSFRGTVITHVPFHPGASTAYSPTGRFGDESDLLIPPHGVATIRGAHVLDRPAMIHSIRGHMHMRGKYQILEAIYPDGSWETLSKLNWDHGWHTLVLYEDHVMPLLPKGTVLTITSTWDNTTENPHNPDPNQWVTGGDRSVDEMGHIRLGITYFDDEAEFQEIVEERRRMLGERSTVSR